MSYIRADRILPAELLESLQQYAAGKTIYVPGNRKQKWGSGTAAKEFFCERNNRIYEAFQRGTSVEKLSQSFYLSEKSIQRILRNQKRSAKLDDK
ncbi:MAG: hypothetical protein IJ662_06935 [Clostridia bacterium]|nr:hypothetical protein [Clostridia bacterium]